MLFNEQEMISLCSEMGIELIDNDENTNFPVVDSSLFNIAIFNDKFTEINKTNKEAIIVSKEAMNVTNDIKSEIKSKIHKIYTNAHPVYDKTGRIMSYLRPDLSAWANEFAKCGKRYFFTEPVDPVNKYGKLRLCEPKYEYRVDNLTPEEYDMLMMILEEK